MKRRFLIIISLLLLLPGLPGWITAVAGCQPQYNTIPASVCQGDYFFFNNRYYNLPGLYTDTLTAISGCDSIVTLDLTVKPVPAVTITEKAVCQKDSVHLVFTGAAPFELDYEFNARRMRSVVSGMGMTLAASLSGKNIFVVHRLTSANGCSLSEGEEGVEMNGVTWATRNVGAPGAFVEKPEDAGMFYQWNSTAGWSSTDPPVSTGRTPWNGSWDGNGAPAWETANNVCPAGYRLPAGVELQSLAKTSSQWTTLNGVAGRLFDGDDNTIFLPAAGLRAGSGSLSGTGFDGLYWNSDKAAGGKPAYLDFDSIGVSNPLLLVDSWNALSVRCVKSIFQEIITVYPVFLPKENLTVCQNQLPFIWRDTTFAVGSEGGTFVFNRQTVAGCDSIVTLNLTVKPVKFDTLSKTICANDSILFYGNYYSRTGFYTTFVGCDSLTLDLTVIPEATVAVAEKTVCQGDAVRLVFTGVAPFELDYTFNNKREIITVFGMDTALVATQVGENIFTVNHLTSASGCENPRDVEINGVVWATRNVDAPGAFTKNPEDAGMFYVWGSKVGWSSTDPRISSNGSPWFFLYDLLEQNAPRWTITNHVCPAGYRIPKQTELQRLVDAGSQWTTLNGIEGRLFGSGYETIFLPAACSRNSSGEITFSSDGCCNNGIYWSGVAENRHMAYMLRFNRDSYVYVSPSDISECSSVRCVKISTQTEPVQKEVITVSSATLNTVRDTICSNHSVFFNGKYYNRTGLYTDTLQTVLGCDSIVTLDLTARPAYHNTIRAVRCRGEDYRLYNFNLTNVQHSITTAQYLTSALGCDSVTVLDLTVNPLDTTRMEATIYVGGEYHENGFSIPVQHADTTFCDTLRLKNKFLCDSTVILTLNVRICIPDTVSVSDSICEGEPYYFDGKMLSESGIYVESVKNPVECGSIKVLDFNVFPKYYNDIYEEIVSGETYIFNGRTYRRSGVYIGKFSTVSTCDSVVVLRLKVVPKCPEIEIPAFFTPDFNGINDYWKVKNIECYNYKIALYDRFGKELFVWENNFPERGWDGAYLGKPMPSTDYWYLITLEEVEDNYVGHFTLLR